MNATALAASVARTWDTSIVPQLVEYIRIPAKSPHFDPAWEANGHIERVIRLAESWARAQPVRGMTIEIVRLPGRTPVLFFDVPGTGPHTVLLYGHLDKQPEMTGWREESARGSRCRRTASSTVVAARTTATRYSLRSRPSARCRRKACRMRAASA